jgi:threonyl-tRNA synthetase
LSIWLLWSTVCRNSQGLADSCVIAKVNGDVWDLDRPFEKDSQLQLLKFDDPDGKLV